MDQEDSLDIAIIGMSARFPGAKDLDTFWANLKAGKESITFFSEDELAPYHDTQDPDYVKAAPALADIDMFDASFFGYAPREAQMMDPQHRLLLECAATALEHAGYASNTYDGLISVFAGSAMNTYLLFSGLAPKYIDEYLPTLIGNDKDFLATRISYKLNLKGPSVTVQTACSTALVATHMACQSLLNGESDIALAGAVSVRVPHNAGHQYVPGSVFTPDGHCRPFDAKANGTIFGSGVGVVVLKRLDYAIEDGDHIHAVIKGTAINNDGASKVDFTAPSVASQSEAISEALGVSGIDAGTISYVEAHGTGTAIGDPIEIAALTKAYRGYTDANQYCAIGSVKSNIGHLDVAAGMAGLMKTILALKHKQLPATLHYTESNPEINFPKTPFYVNDSLNDWQPAHGIRRAGVSALGIGGTNAHVILEEAPAQQEAAQTDSYQLLLWSAKSEEALETATGNLKDHLSEHPDLSLAHTAYTLQKGRNTFSHKRFVVAKSLQETVDILNDEATDRIYSATQKAASREVVFMFPGQGAQYVNMGRDLYQHETVFRAAIDECAVFLTDSLSLDIRELLYPKEGLEDEATQKLKNTAYTQPALFTVSYALSRLFASWGIEAEAFIGHSIGEYVAACLAGVFSLEDALRIVAKRGQLMQAMPKGSMLAIPAPEEDIQPYLSDTISLAAVNGTSLCVVSGDTASIDALAERLSKNDIDVRKLHTSHGFHSTMMQPAADAFKEYLNQFTLHSPTTAFISNLTGTWITGEQATAPQYWADHLRNAVLFEAGLRELLKDSSRLFLEVGPGRTLSTLLRMHPDRMEQQKGIPSMRHPKRTESDQLVALQSLGQLWLQGVTPDWDLLHQDDNTLRIPLPTYPFARQSHWFEAQPGDPSGALTVQAPSPAIHNASHETSLFYGTGWKRLNLVHSGTSIAPATWLVFTDATSFSKQVVSALETKGHTVLTLQQGKEYKQVGATSWMINPTERLHYDRVLADIKKADHLPTHLLHAWNLNSTGPVRDARLTLENYEEALHAGFFSLLYLAQALQQQDYVHPITACVLSANAHEVMGTEDVVPLQATLHGPCRVIEKESPNIRTLQIDIDSASESDVPAFTQKVHDLLESTSYHSMVAFRGRHFWIPEFSPTTIDLAHQKIPVKQKGVYLITGGQGGLGLAFAHWLAKEYQATLLLLGRSPLPEKKEWPAVLNDPTAKDTLKQKIEAIRQLESFGATVVPVQADVTQREEIKAVIKKAQNTYNGLNGVIHTAGVIEDTMLALKDKASVLRVLAPKIQGTTVLGELLDPSSIDFFVLCSSTNAYLSPAGQIDYTAANGFQDAFAYAHRQVTGMNTISINWPGWKETGMLAAKKEAFGDQAWFKREFNRGITTQEGIAGLQHALAVGSPQCIVSKERFELDTKPSAPSNALASLPSAGSDGVPPPSATNLQISSAQTIEEQLKHIWSGVLGIKEIGPNDDFFELGGHSLLAVTLFKKMERALGALHLPISALIQAPTIAKFSSLLDKEEDKPETWSNLVPIQEGSAPIPLFCIHGAGGNILIYREMASMLGPQYTVYGIESLGLDGKQEMPGTISDMAGRYVDEIRHVHPEGPYLLVGYCMGGTIALEMAQQLKAQGEDVPFLALIETYNWINLKPLNAIGKAIYYWQKIEFHARNLMLLPATERKVFWQEKLSVLKRRTKVWSGMIKNNNQSSEKGEDALHHTALASVWKNNDDAALDYQPSFYEGKITHFRAQQEYNIHSDSSMRFENLAKEVETRILPVYPAGMMVPPFVSRLADEIASRIEHLVEQNQAKDAPLEDEIIDTL